MRPPPIIDAIVAYIAQDNPFAAERVDRRLHAAIDKLAEINSGRIGRMPGTFEKLVKGLPYIIAFELPGKHTLRILRVVHGARDWPEGGWPED